MEHGRPTTDDNAAMTLTPRGGRGVRVGLFVGIAIGVALFGFIGVRVKQALTKQAALAQERTSAQDRVQRKEPLKTVRPTPTTWMPRVELTGTLKPWREADVGFETGGRLMRVNVSVGDTVTAGQLLAVLDASRAAAEVGQADSQVRAAEASLAMAEDSLRRTEPLVASKAVPEAEAVKAKQELALAKARLEGALASSRLAKSGAGLHSVTAPFAGIVTKAPTGIGSVVNPGVPLIHVEDTSRYRLSATVGEEDVGFVTVGAPVKVTYRDHVVAGKVIALVPSLDQATRRAPVEIEVPRDRTLLAWGFVRARIEGSAPVDAVRVPALARRPGSQDEVVRIDRSSIGGDAAKGVARITKVSFAVDEDGSLVVQRGLAATDEVILSPDVETRDGETVDARTTN